MNGEIVDAKNGTVLINFPTYKSCMAGFKNLKGAIINDTFISTILIRNVNEKSKSLSQHTSLTIISTQRPSVENRNVHHSTYNISKTNPDTKRRKFKLDCIIT